MMKIGNSNIIKAAIGTKEIEKIFLGRELIYSSIPSIYQRIEYLSANGNNWISTGVGADIDNTEIEFEGDEFTNTSALIMVASTSSGNQFRIVKFTASLKIGGSVATGNVTSTANGTSLFKAKLNKEGLWIDDVLIGTFTLPTILPVFGNIDIFRGKYSGTSYYAGAGNIRMASIKKNEKYVFYGIPCRRKSDDELGLYDTVTGTFFTNQGSGSFTPGPDI